MPLWPKYAYPSVDAGLRECGQQHPPIRLRDVPLKVDPILTQTVEQMHGEPAPGLDPAQCRRR
jgi:hypothetical protein